MLGEAVLECVRVFAGQGHSGASAAITTAFLEKVLRYEPLTPLTDDPAEWNAVGEGVWQSRRNSEAFSDDGGKTYTLLSERQPVHDSAPSQEVKG